jgi:cell division protein FtsZ
LFNITGGADLSMTEVDDAAKIISAAADPDANIIFGATIDESMQDKIKISVIATGFDHTRQTLKEFVRPVVNAAEKQEVQDEQQAPTPEKPVHEDANDDAWDIPAFLRQRN